MHMSEALSGVLTLLALIATGFVMNRQGVFSAGAEDTMTRITVRYAVPALLFNNALNNISPQFLVEMGWRLLVPAATMMTTFGIGWLAVVIFKVDSRRRGIFHVSFTVSNTIFIGLPVVMSIFGDAAISSAMAYYLSNTVFFWTIGNFLIARDGGKRLRLNRETMQMIVSPPVIGLFLGFLAGCLPFRPPVFLTSTLAYLGQLGVPMSLLITGAFLSKMGSAAYKLTRDGWLILAGRLLVAPSVAVLFSLLLGLSPLMAGVYIIMASMPIMNQAVIMARHHGSDYQLAAQMIAITTLSSLVCIPLLMIVIQHIFG